MGERGGRQKKSDIPYPAKDPRYKSIYYQMHARGLTLAEAAKKVVGEEEATKVLQKYSKSTPQKNGHGRGARNGAVSADAVLDHPDVPEKVKEKIRAAQGDQPPSRQGPPTAEKTGPRDNRVTVPLTGLTGTLDLTPLMSVAGVHQPTRLETIEKLLSDIAKSTATIAFQLTRIADKQTGISVTSTTPPAPDPQPVNRSPPPPPSPPPERKTDNGITVGCQATWKGRKGKVTRIMPGRREIEIQFIDGRKTVLADQVKITEATA